LRYSKFPLPLCRLADIRESDLLITGPSFWNGTVLRGREFGFARRRKARNSNPQSPDNRDPLPSGKHALQLVLGDAKHYPFNPPLVSEKLTVRIK
jgi:hypothetical protein